MSLGLGVSNANVDRVGDNDNFLSRVLALFTGRNEFSVALGYSNSARISFRRSTRSVNVYLKLTFGRTLNRGHNVMECNDVLLPVSRTLVLSTVSFSNEPRLICGAGVHTGGINRFSMRLYRRF